MSDKENERPYQRHYDLGFNAGFTNSPSAACPYLPSVGAERSEVMARRMAWLEGHSDGQKSREQIIRTGRVSRTKGPRKRATTPSEIKPRAVVQRRFQRGRMRDNGGPERYVDRRLRQIAAEHDAVHTSKK